MQEILKRDDSEIISQVFNAQLNDPVPGDWTETIKKDLLEFNLNHLSFESIKAMKKAKFKTIVKKACKENAFKYLISIKEGKTKLDNCEYKELKIRNYLKSDKLSSRKQKLLFKLRTRMIDVGNNYGKINLCPLICIALDDQQHIFKCKQLNSTLEVTNNFNYEDIFSENSKQFVNATNLIRKKEEKTSALAKSKL